ncbi:MFS general substrate transporter [Hysterangium stoloniferum]|nr:MFS general substrate transporter [Hysterangium stoloniferum]
MSANEHTPLLRENPDHPNGTVTSNVDKVPANRLGPMEISAANRRWILVGVWMATFLSTLNMWKLHAGHVKTRYFPVGFSSWKWRRNFSVFLFWYVSLQSRELHGLVIPSKYLLATCTFTPLYGRLSNVMGRRGANQTAVFFAGLACEIGVLRKVLRVFSVVLVWDSAVPLVDGLATGGGRLGWRWEYLIQIPIFAASFALTGYNLHYVIPRRGKSTKDVLKRIDYGGSLTLFLSVGSLLFFLSYKYNDDLPFNSPAAIVSIIICIATFIAFILVELLIAPEPVLLPFCLAVMYFFPMFFETVMLTSASTAGAHLLPNSMAMSTGSLFAGWIMSTTGKYRIMDMVFGTCPAIATMLLTRLNENSAIFTQWFTISLINDQIPLGFGNPVVFQTTLLALLVNVDRSAMAVATGFVQLWRCIVSQIWPRTGQVCGVTFASAVLQSILGRELTKRITGPDAAESGRDASTRSSTTPASVLWDRSTIGVCTCGLLVLLSLSYSARDKSLDDEYALEASPSDVERQPEEPIDSCAVADDAEEAAPTGGPPRPTPPGRRIPRRLSTYESIEGGMDLEDETAGSARR